MLEIEAKFAIPDEATFRQLGRVRALAGYALSAGRTDTLTDTFLDTPSRAIRSAGYYLRQRDMEGREGLLVTLKALASAAEAVHRREEIESVLPCDQPPADWPAGPLRERVLGMIGEEPLHPVLSLRQIRTTRAVRRGRRTVAVLGLDRVEFAAGGRVRTDLDLEVELTADGTEEDLVAMAAALQAEWGLAPQRRSKFERAMAWLEEASASHNAGPEAGEPCAARRGAAAGLLAPEERAICQGIARRGDLHGRRARALLALDGGVRQAEAGRIAGMSVRRVRYWLAAFRRQRLGIFPRRVLSAEKAISQMGTSTETSAGAAVATPPAGEPVAPAPATPPMSGPGIVLGDTMAEAARKTLLFHFRRMLEHEPGVRQGQDIEAVHDMRVATRRMRAALRLFADYLEAEALAPFARMLRNTGRALGTVRDLEVFYEKAQRYLDRLPAGQRGELAPILSAWEEHYQSARQELLTYLDSERYRRFKEEFGAFLERPGAGARPALSSRGEPRPRLLRHVVPAALYQNLATVRAYEEWLQGTGVPLQRYHQLRIASKGLRYSLEFFREVLGPEATELIERVKALQDHLGELQDAVVACGILRDFLTWGTWGDAGGKKMPRPAEPVVAPGVAAYLAYRQTEIQELLASFPPVWQRVCGPDFVRLLASCIAVLQ